LEDFPNNVQEARFLQRKGIVPDRFFILADEKEFWEKEKVSDYSHMLDCYKGYFNLIDINGKSEKAVQDDIIAVLNYRVRMQIPVRPPRVVVINPPGLGFNEMTE